MGRKIEGYKFGSRHKVSEVSTGQAVVVENLSSSSAVYCRAVTELGVRTVFRVMLVAAVCC